MQRASRPEWGKWGLIGFSDVMWSETSLNVVSNLFQNHWIVKNNGLNGTPTFYHLGANLVHQNRTAASSWLVIYACLTKSTSCMIHICFDNWRTLSLFQTQAMHLNWQCCQQQLLVWRFKLTNLNHHMAGSIDYSNCHSCVLACVRALICFWQLCFAHDHANLSLKVSATPMNLGRF